MLQNEVRHVHEFGPFKDTGEVITVINSMLSNPRVLKWVFPEGMFNLDRTMIVRWQIMKDQHKTYSRSGKLVSDGIIDDTYYLFVEFRLYKWISQAASNQMSVETELREVI